MTVPQPNFILEAALAYAAKGWRIFPCDPHAEKPRSKRPLVVADKDESGNSIEGSGWPKKATTEETQIRAWWRRWPDALIGMAPAWANAFVIDLDPKGEPVEAVEARLVAALGAPLPIGPRTRTQSGGLHVWFRRPDGGPWGNETPGLTNIDIRCDHGYVILPPSRLKNGNSYSWVSDDIDAELPDLPQGVLDLIENRKAKGGTYNPGVAREPTSKPRFTTADDPGTIAVKRYVSAAVDRIAAELASTGHQRGTALYSAACQLGRFIASGTLSERSAVAALIDAADANGLLVQDGGKSVERDIQRGFDEGRSSAGDISKRLDEIRREAQDKAARRASRPPPANPEDYGYDTQRAAPRHAEDSNAPGNDNEPIGDDADGSLTGGRRRHGLDRIGRFDCGAYPYRYWSRLGACARLDQSDTDNATRFKWHRGQDVLVRIQEGGRAPLWVAWTGTHWNDVTGNHAVKAIAQTIGEEIKRERYFLGATAEEKAIIEAGEVAGLIASDKQGPAEKSAINRMIDVLDTIGKRQSDRKKFGISSKNEGRISAMMSGLAPHVLIAPEKFNADPFRIATPSQTLIFQREIDLECPDPTATRYLVNFEARPGHDRRDYLTALLGWDYNPKAKCPRWLAFMQRFLPDEPTRRFVQIAFALGLLGISEQVLIFHYGGGANGKSVALEVISRVLGPLAAGLPAEALSGDDNGGVKASPEIARLFGKRLVRVSEVKEGTPLQEAFVKRITGSETFPARNLFEGYFEFKPIFVAHMTGNGYPKISGTDNGIWRRMRVVKWPVTLKIEEQRQFEDVVGELMDEAPGILAWLVEGARIYLAEGLIPPPSVVAETQIYRDEMDSVGRFVRACVTVTGNWEDVVTGKPLYDAYVAWAEASGLRPVSNTRFGIDMPKTEGVIKEEKRVVTYHNIQLHDVPRNPSNDPWNGDKDPRSW